MILAVQQSKTPRPARGVFFRSGDTRRFAGNYHLADMQRFWYSILLALIVGATAVVYWPGRTGGFAFDDFGNIVENRDVKITTLSRESLAGAAFSAPMEGPGRPLSMLSFGLNHAISGLTPLPYKLTNIAIHILAVIIAFFLSREIFASLRETGRASPTREQADLYSLGVAAIFALHPIQLTSVLYVVQRMTSLAGIFTLAGLLGYVVARRRMWRGAGGLPTLVVVPTICTVLGFLAKENGILLPVITLAIEAVVFRFQSSSGTVDRRVVVWHVAFVIAPAMMGVAWLAFDPQRFLSGYAVRDFSLVERLLTEGRVLLVYLKNLVAPSIIELGLYHDDIVISRGLFDPATTLPALVALVSLVGLAWYARNRIPLVSLGILWFFAGHLMESTILPLEIAHEHRNYVPTFGFALAAAGLANSLALVRCPRWVPSVSLTLFVGLLGLTTWLRSTQWSNPYEHVESEIRHHPRSSRANYDAGRLWGMLAMRGESNAAKRAIEHFEHAAELDPGSTMPLVTAIILSNKNHLSIHPVWIAELKERYRNSPISPAAVSSLKWLVRCASREGCVSDKDIVAILDSASRNYSLVGFARFQADISTVYGEYLVNARGDVRGAEEKFRQAIATVPRLGQYRVNLVNLLLASARPDDAARELDALRALRRSAISKHRLALLENDLANLRAHLATN